jgi:hypothetical protein
VPGVLRRQDRDKAKGRNSVIGTRPGWCEVRADIGEGIDADPLLLRTTDPNNRANECC